MKKSIIALAVASAASLGVAQADNTTLYGSVRMAVENVSISNGGGSSTAVTNASSRFGIKGSDDLGNGLSAIYHFEFGVDPNRAGSSVTLDEDDLNTLNNLGANDTATFDVDSGFGNRLGYVGLKGGFGTVALGRQWTPYYNVLGYNDLYNGSFSYRTYMGPYRAGNVLSYVTPDSLGGFKGSLALLADGAAGKNHLDAFNVALEYANNGIYAGLTYLKNKNTDTGLLGGAIGYSNDMFKVGLTAERAKAKNVNNKPIHVSLAGEYYINEANTIRASVATRKKTFANKDFKANEYAVGYQHNLSNRTRVWAEYSVLDVKNGDDNKVLSLGLRSDF